MLRALEGRDIRHLDPLVVDARHEAAFHEDGIGGRIGAQAMEARLAVEKPLRRIHGTGELVVEKAAAVIQPLRIRRLGVHNRLGQVGARRHVEHVERGILAAVLRQSVHYVPPVRRGIPPIERHVTLGVAHGGGIDQYPRLVSRPAAHEELVIIGTERTLLIEQGSSGPLDPRRRDRIARELPDSREQRGPIRQCVEHGAGVIVLSLQEGQPLRVLVVLHPAIRIAQRFAEIRISDHVDARHRCGW
jgi:hypothetical protein